MAMILPVWGEKSVDRSINKVLIEIPSHRFRRVKNAQAPFVLADRRQLRPHCFTAQTRLIASRS